MTIAANIHFKLNVYMYINCIKKFKISQQIVANWKSVTQKWLLNSLYNCLDLGKNLGFCSYRCTSRKLILQNKNHKSDCFSILYNSPSLLHQLQKHNWMILMQTMCGRPTWSQFSNGRQTISCMLINLWIIHAILTSNFCFINLHSLMWKHWVDFTTAKVFYHSTYIWSSVEKIWGFVLK